MNALDVRTPVTLLTGFLGSGKTSLLNRALRSPHLAATAVVVNEFGAVPLDHLLSEASNDQIVVLENGCLCCTVFGDLITTLNRLYHDREARRIPHFDRIVIETSGLADPRPLLQAFLSDPTLEGLFRLDAVLAMLDAVNGPGTLARHDEAVHQLALCDRVVISKLDLLAAHLAPIRAAVLRKRVHELNPSGEVFLQADPSVDPVELLVRAGCSTRGDALDAFSGAHLLQEGTPKVSTFCLVREEPTSLYGLELLLGAVEKNLGPALLRIKGLVHVRERPESPAVIQGAQHLLHNLRWLDRWPREDRTTRLVFITSGIDRTELEDMVALLDRIAQRTALARERACS